VQVAVYLSLPRQPPPPFPLSLPLAVAVALVQKEDMHKFIAHNYHHPSQFISTSTSTSVSASASVSRRSACDRCRGQKLRCIRDVSSAGLDSAAAAGAGGAGGCRRCLKMGADCLTTITSKRNAKRGIQRRQQDKESAMSTSDVENNIRAATNTDTNNWLSWDLPSLSTLEESRDAETYNLDVDDNNGQFDMLAANEDEGFQIFDPMLFSDGSLFLHDDNAAELVQHEQAEEKEEKEEKEEEEINLHTIASTLDQYLLQINVGPPEMTLSKILFTTSPPSANGEEEEEEEKEKKKKKCCQRAHTVDSILQHTTHFINILKSTGEKETQTLLRMLAIYTTILKLFLIIFAHVHIFLEDVTTTTAIPAGKKNNKKITALEPVPDVQFIGFDIRTFPP
jgi:hypothetical protein